MIALRLRVPQEEIDRGQDGAREYHHRGEKDHGFGHRGERQHIFSVVRLKPQSSFAAGGGKRRLGIGGTNNQLIGTLGYVADPKVVLTCRCPTVILFRPRCVMDSKRKVEVFSAGCAFCHEVIDVVRREAGSSSQIIVHNMTDARSLVRAEQFGIRSVPAVVIDGKLSPCCTGSVDIQALKNELKKGS